MFEDPDGQVHIVMEGSIIGRERATVSRILNREVIVTEKTVNYLGVQSLYERIISLPNDGEFEQNIVTNTKEGAAKGAKGKGTKSEEELSPALIRQLTQERAGGTVLPGGPAGAAGAVPAQAATPPQPPAPQSPNFNTLKPTPAAPPVPTEFRNTGGNGGLTY